jgi:hypothetical protein
MQNLYRVYRALVMLCLTPLSTVFELYRGGHFYLWGETRKKPTDVL